MIPNLTYTGRVTEDGEIHLPSKKLKEEVSRSMAGKQVEVTFKVKRRQRSNPQNAYYWSAVIPSVLDGLIDLGHNFQSGNKEHEEMLHGWLKSRFLDNGLSFADANGEEHKMPPSTKICTTTEFAEYLDAIIMWAAEDLHIKIPQPEEQGELQF